MSRLLIGDCRTSMRALIAEGVKVQMCVTSPPYWGLRDYGCDGQLGLEASIPEFIGNMVDVFDLVRELLADDGTLWLNIGDSYAGSGRGGHVSNTSTLQGSIEHEQECKKARGSQLAPGLHAAAAASGAIGRAWVPPPSGLKQKDLCGIPWRLAFALQEAGWWLRQDIIWHKPNPMPESIKDRCTKAHEYLFLMAKSERYLCDMDAIAEPVTLSTIERLSQPNLDNQEGSATVPGKTNGNMKAVGKGNRKTFRGGGVYTQGRSFDNDSDVSNDSVGNEANESGTRNKRSVWTVATQGYSEAHFATYPPALIEPCILAGSKPGDIVFDPFFGSGTTGEVAQRLGREWIGCELNPEYGKLAERRTSGTIGMQLVNA